MGVPINGFVSKITRLGKYFDKHSQMPVEDKDYWPWVVLGSEIDGWPSERYPMLFYTSTDHGSVGGIYLRVWDRDLGELTQIVDGEEVANPNVIVEWQDISSRSEFSHISKKTNPIFVDSGNGSQTETPSVIKANGQLYLYYHNNAVDLTGYGKGATGKTYQSTKYAIGTNGVDFSGNNLSTLWYDAYQVEGDGHNGYFNPSVNVISELPYAFIGVALHGGGGLERGSTNAFYGSNDCENWYKIDVASLMYGDLENGPDWGAGRVLFPALCNIKKEGAYYRTLSNTRLRVSGGASTEGEICEVLIDGNLNVVSHLKTVLPNSVAGSFDQESVGSITNTVTFEGREYGFYKGIDNSGTHSIGGVVIETEPTTWDVFEPLSEKQTLFETDTPLDGVAPNLTYSQAAFFKDKTVEGALENTYLTFIPLPTNGTPSTVVSTFEVDLSSHDVVDVLFRPIGKNWGDPQTLEFGLTDNLSSPTSKLAYFFPAGNNSSGERSEPMQIAVLGASDETNRITKNYFGQSDNWNGNSYDESPYSKHRVGIRIIPSENKIVTLEGRSICDVFDITGFDYSKPLKVFIDCRAIPPHSTERHFSFGGITVNAYSRNAVAVPSAPTLTTSKSSESITLSTNSVTGATGYKYFLDDQQNDTGVFTGLEPETEYTVYARAVNALGDSEPSTIQTVTTDAAVVSNQPPIANAGPDLSVAAGVEFVLDGTGSQDTDGTIVEWRWTQTAGDNVTLDESEPSSPRAISPSRTSAQTLTFRLVTVDDEGAVSSPSLVNIDVAAVVQNDVLNIIDKISFTFESDGMITAFPGRANRETFRLKPSDPTGLVLEDGWFDFEANDVRRVEISILETTGVKIISSDTDSITRERSKLHVRMGDMTIKSSTKEFEPTVSVFVGNDERGVVMTAPGLSGAPKVKYYSTTARAV
mgnify:CR=1 FL=1